MASAYVTINGLSSVNATSVTAGDSVSIELADHAGVNSWSLVCINMDETGDPNFANENGLVIDNASKTAVLTTSGNVGEAYIFESRVNGGIGQNSIYKFKIYVPTLRGLDVVATGETTESSSKGWIGIVNSAVRGLDSLASSIQYSETIPVLGETNIASALQAHVKQVSGIADVAPSGSSYTLTANEYANNQIRVVGALSANTTLIFPLLIGRKWTVINETTGGYSLTVKGSTGNGVYVPAYNTTTVRVDHFGSNFVYGAEHGRGLEFCIPVSLTGAAGLTSTALVMLPYNFKLCRAELLVTTSLVGGGTETFQAGTYSGDNSILVATSVPAAGNIIGDQIAHFGTALAAPFYEKFYPSGGQFWIRRIITGSTITQGAGMMYISGYMMG